ncbi:MlaD family protein [[Mycobacterium] wendilense]|uniref:MlaD family protein n=1 Tax=[Mycobacterium] wendilense TaxID=3064284 RepID=A0ABM9M946_9MYCO|nr:MlaD family protein [Mycolicibacterium sp. MU0050]CAJ1579460.1 MlaD family protein [Mycolicibacterium sp. MU0050]
MTSALGRILAAAMVIVAAAALTSCGTRSDTAGGYCAVLADGIGLYPGNPVTQMGYPIGTVTAVEPDFDTVRVRFTISTPRRIPADVKAVIRSMSILADRSLELVGNYRDGPELVAEQCIPPNRTATPKSLSELVGSIATFAEAISPDGSTNVADTVRGLEQALFGQGVRAGEFLSRLSALLDSPDGAISDTGSIVRNLAHLTGELSSVRGILKQVLLDAEATTGDLVVASDGVMRMTQTLPLMVTMIADLERELGEQTQRVLDTVSVPLRKASPHATALSDLLNPIPGWITTVSDRFNDQGLQLKWRPPMFRIRTQDGLLLCGIMNARVPGSCADIAGTPYAVDVALLQYALTEATR